MPVNEEPLRKPVPKASKNNSSGKSGSAACDPLIRILNSLVYRVGVFATRRPVKTA